MCKKMTVPIKSLEFALKVKLYKEKGESFYGRNNFGNKRTMQAVSQTDCAEKYQYENSERVCIRAFGSKWRRKIDIDENIVRDDAGSCREEANDSV